MDQIGQQKLKILDKYHVLSRAFQYQDIQQSRIRQKTLAISDFFEAFQYEAIYAITGVNSTLKASHKAPSCMAGNDVRCRYWYALTAQQEYVQIYPPRLTYGYSTPSLSSLSCQRIMLFNQTTQQDDLQSVICSGLYFNQTQNYFQNFASSTKQVYFLEPTSQILLYDSKQPLGVTNIETLNSSEFQYLQSQNEAFKFNNTLNQNYANPIFKNISNLNTEYLDEANSFNQTFSYDRNGTKTIAILNPVYVIDKSPQFQNLQNNKKASQYLIKFPYVQVNIISNENLKIHAQQIEDFFQIYFLAFNISFGFLGLISILVVASYTSKIKNIFYISIDQLTDILIKMNDKNLSSSIFDIISNEQQLSLDASQLYDSFKQIYQIMLYSSEDFYNQNDTEQLLKLNQNIEFFKQFGNKKAVGITYNNIGSILLKQEHYFQALENFQSSIIYARYEIQEFLTQHPNCVIFGALQSFSYLQLEQQQGNQEVNKKIDTIYQLSQKDSFAQMKIRDKEKSIFSINRANNNIQKVSESYCNNKERIFQESKQNGELKEQGIELLNNLYQRERNFIVSLQALQEHFESLRQMQHSSNEFNFWPEIEQLSKRLIKITNHLPQSKQLQVEIMLLMSRCYFKMNNLTEQQNMLLYCRKQLSQIQINERENNQKQICSQSIFNFNEKYSPLVSSKQIKKFTRGIQLFHKGNQSQNIQSIGQQQQNIVQDETQNSLILNGITNFQNEVVYFKDQKVMRLSMQSNQPLDTLLLSSIQNKLKFKDMQINQFFQDSFQQHNLSILENLFELFRNIEQDQQEQQFFKNYFSFENLDLMLSFAQIAQLIYAQNYFSASDMITKIFEEKKRIMSHYRYKIIDQLYSIFKSQRIESNDVNSMKQNLKHDLGIHVQVIFSNQQGNIQILKLLQLISNLTSSILTKKRDQISITLTHKSDNFIQTYLPLIGAYKINKIMGKIIKDIIQLTTSEEEFPKIFIRANEMFEENQLFGFQNIDEINKKMLQMDVSKYEIQNSFNESNLEREESQIRQNVQHSTTNSNCLEFNKKLLITESFSKSTTQKSFRESKKIEYVYGDDLINLDLNDYCIQDTSQSYQFQQKSDQFHFAVRKAIAQFIQKEYFMQNNNLQQYANFNNVNNLKYIIYCTDTIQILDNRMFKLLCELLIGLKIKLIILAQQNRNSFIEQQENQTDIHDYQNVVMVFYEPQQVLNYINNLRCQFNKKVYPTIIQSH